MNKEFIKALFERDPYAKLVAQAIGEPINLALPSPIELDAIANTVYLPAGEKAWAYQAYDTDAGEILTINLTTGAMVVVKRSPVSDTEITLAGYSSKFEHFLVTDILSTPDQGFISRKKEIMVENIDKKEVRLITNALLSPTSGGFTASNIQSESLDSGEDLYEVIQNAINKIKDYSNGGTLLAGTSVDNAIDNWDKTKAGTFNYKVSIKGVDGLLARNNIQLLRVFGTVRETDGGALNRLLDAESAILVGTNSKRKLPKPITVVRRLIDPELAQLIGAKSLNPSRIVLTGQAPTNSGTGNVFAIASYAFESIAVVITDPNRVVTMADIVS